MSPEPKQALTVMRVLREGSDNARVLLCDGRRIKVPLSLGTVGNIIAYSDIVDVLFAGKVDWIHISLKKEKRQPKVYNACRKAPTSYKEQNARALSDLTMIKRCIRLYLKSLPLKSRMSEEEHDDLASDIYIHMFIRGYCEAHDPNQSSYLTWIYYAVRNYLITHWRSRSLDFMRSMLRLDASLDHEPGVMSEGAATLHDIIKDTSLISCEEKCMTELTLDRFKIIAASMDEAALFEDGLPSYLDIFEAIQDNDFEALVENYVGSNRKRQFTDKYNTFKEYCSAFYLEELAG